MVILSGCVSGGPTSDLVTEDEPESTRGAIVVTTDSEATVVNVTEGTGTVYGEVLNDAGFGLPGARVTVWGANQGDSTNATGWFEVVKVSPGTRSIRAEHPYYQAAESQVEVEAGKARRVTITLIPVVEGDPNQQPHPHDYWVGRSQVVVTDSDVEFHEADPPGPRGETRRISRMTSTLYVRGCTFENEFASEGPIIDFDDPNQLVWPGTSRIDVQLTWSPSAYVGGETLTIGWKAANASRYYSGKSIRSGETSSIAVEPPMWDSAHQAFTLWEIGVCVASSEEGKAGPGEFAVGRMFVGSLHAVVTLVRGHPLVVDSPHPRFWANGSIQPVVESYRNFTCTTLGQSERCLRGPKDGREGGVFVWRVPNQVLVPPGATRLVARLNWSYQIPLQNKPITLAFSAADQPPREKTQVYSHSAAEVSEDLPYGRTFTIPLKPGQRDSFYQTTSNWAFSWFYDGEEDEGAYVHWCGCELKMHLDVKAVRD